MRKHLLAIAVILTVATGCDNVAWGGIDMEMKPPPPSSRTAAEADEPPVVVAPVNVAGPILLAGTRTGARADFVIVGEVHPGVVREFPHPAFPDDTTRLQQVTAPGSEWILFSEGVRVGRMVADAVRPAEGFCGARAQLSGFVELVPTASGAERLLALPAETSSRHPYGTYTAIAHDYDQRVATLSGANRAIPANGAAWPPLGVLDARDHIQAFQLAGIQGRSIAATFLHQDDLTVASPGPGAYSLFLMSQQVGTAYQETYLWYRSVEAEGKGAPRYFDHLDWDGNGSEDILLDVFGSNRRWFAVLSQRDGSWTRSFEDPCGSGSATGS